MSIEITGSYGGQLKVALRHGPSGTEISTAAPVDNQGDGSSFSPTDLVAAALGACMMTLIGIVADRDGVDLKGSAFRVEKEMLDDPRRIGKLSVVIDLPAELGPGHRRKLERAALTCPVHRSLHAEIDIPVLFRYPDAS